MAQGVIPNFGTVLPNTPDTAGFRDAMYRLNQALGENVIFRTPTAAVYDPNVQIDPETGQPYDPLANPISGGGYTDVAVNVTVALKEITGGDDVIEGPSGVRRDETPAFIVMDFDYPKIQYATVILWRGDAYKIMEVRPDGLTSVFRFLVFCDIT